MYTEPGLASHIAYLRRLLRYKRLVVREGARAQPLSLQLLRYDLPNFLPDEWQVGVAFFRNDSGNDDALRRHRARNRHHPQGWVEGGKVGKMPDRFRLEMLADWRAMARERRGEVADWYEKKVTFFPCHPDTRAWIEKKFFGRVSPQTSVSRQAQAELPEDRNEP